MEPILKIKNLKIQIDKEKEAIVLLDNINFNLEKGKILGIIGESGSGKTITALGILNLLPECFYFLRGEIFFDGKDILNMDLKNLQKLRGKKISMVFQEPLSVLNPLLTVGFQIYETITSHDKLSRTEAKEKANALLNKVGFQNSEEIYSKYPHQLSGGMRQKIVIAIAIANDPEVLIADEPTSSLDIVSEKEIMDLLKSFNTNDKMSIIFITHDLNLVKDFADDIILMHDAGIVENASTKDIFENPKHDYTKKLVNLSFRQK